MKLVKRKRRRAKTPPFLFSLLQLLAVVEEGMHLAARTPPEPTPLFFVCYRLLTKQWLDFGHNCQNLTISILPYSLDN